MYTDIDSADRQYPTADLDYNLVHKLSPKWRAPGAQVTVCGGAGLAHPKKWNCPDCGSCPKELQ